jgi:hypothetical protein
MPNFKIIGADLKEYGPVGAQQIRQWITEGRLDSETKLQVEGGADWKRLADVPELAAALPVSVGSVCPTCGERFEEGFDTCWKCGTGRDGSPPMEFRPVENASTEEPEYRGKPCPVCGSPNVRLGRLLSSGDGRVVFEPAGKRFFTFSLYGGVALDSAEDSACLDCGLVWSHLQPGNLKEFVLNHCAGSGKEVASALLSESARLESEGDTVGALARYETIVQRFQGTEAARDAEAGIRRLKAKGG